MVCEVGGGDRGLDCREGEREGRRERGKDRKSVEEGREGVKKGDRK